MRFNNSIGNGIGEYIYKLNNGKEVQKNKVIGGVNFE